MKCSNLKNRILLEKLYSQIMVIIIQLIVAILICIVVPVLIGDLLLPNEAIGKQYIMGILTTLAISQALYLPFIIYQHPFTPYFVVYVLAIGTLCVLSVVKRHCHYGKSFRAMLDVQRKIGNINMWMILAFLLIGIQVARVAFGHFFVYADNARYIPIINDIIETDKDYYLDFVNGVPKAKETDIKYIYTTYFPYLASICKVSGLHASILVQTVLPIILTITLYVLVWHYGEILFTDKQTIWMFMLFFGILVETTGGFDNTHANAVVSGIYFGKKIIFTILLPYILLFIAEKSSLLNKEATSLKIRDVLLLVIMMTGICAPSLMGTGLAPIALFSMGLVLSIRRKSLLPFAQMLIAMIPSVTFLLMAIYHLYFRG